MNLFVYKVNSNTDKLVLKFTFFTQANVRKNEIAIQEERDNRSRLEMIVRQTQSKTQEFEDRIRRCEDGIRVSFNFMPKIFPLLSKILKIHYYL